MIEHGAFFFTREETAVKSHRLTNVGSAQIENLSILFAYSMSDAAAGTGMQ